MRGAMIGWAFVCAVSTAGMIAASACGGGPDVKYPADAAAGTPVETGSGAQVGVVDGAGTSGLTGSAKSIYEDGWQAWLKGDLQTAKKKFQDANAADPKSPAPLYSLGVVQERLGDLAGAQQSYRQAFTNDPNHEISMCAYAVSLAQSGHTGEADTFLQSKRNAKQENPRLTACNAEVKSLAGDHAGAQQLAQDALRMDPNSKEAMVAVARDHYRARKLDLAKYALAAILEGFGEAAPARDKDNAEAHLLRGLIFREQGQRAVAFQDFDAAVKKRPDNVEALLNLGSMRLEAGNAIEAQPVLENAVKFGPNSALAHLNLGDCYRLLGKYNEAKSEFDKALSLDSSLAAVHYDLGLMYLTAPSMPGTNADQQVSTAIKELNTYKTMRGPKAPPGVQDDIDSLLDRAKAKQDDLKNQVAQPAASGGAAAPPPAAGGGTPAPPKPATPPPPASGAAPAKPAGSSINRDNPF